MYGTSSPKLEVKHGVRRIFFFFANDIIPYNGPLVNGFFQPASTSAL